MISKLSFKEPFHSVLDSWVSDCVPYAPWRHTLASMIAVMWCAEMCIMWVRHMYVYTCSATLLLPLGLKRLKVRVKGGDTPPHTLHNNAHYTFLTCKPRVSFPRWFAFSCTEKKLKFCSWLNIQANNNKHVFFQWNHTICCTCELKEAVCYDHSGKKDR